MIFSENRFTLFRIMFPGTRPSWLREVNFALKRDFLAALQSVIGAEQELALMTLKAGSGHVRAVGSGHAADHAAAGFHHRAGTPRRLALDHPPGGTIGQK